MRTRPRAGGRTYKTTIGVADLHAQDNDPPRPQLFDREVVDLVGIEDGIIGLEKLGDRRFVRPHFQTADTDRSVHER